MINIEQLCLKAKNASRDLALAESTRKNEFLEVLANWLLENQEAIISENEKDVIDGRNAGLSDAMVDRLTLTVSRIKSMADDLQKVVTLPDPIGEVFEPATTKAGLNIEKRRVPLGVIAVIYESRPNVTIDVSALAIKSGNAIILRGGKETIRTNKMLIEGIHRSLIETGFDKSSVQFIDEPDRSHVERLLKMHAFVDMLIPRGGAGLHKYCRENSTIPVITGGIGICHLFVDESADIQRSLKVIRNAKIQRPTVCNALDTVLVHQKHAEKFIPKIIQFLEKDEVKLWLDERAISYLLEKDSQFVAPAGDDDFDKEWLSYNLGIKVVVDLEEAIEHIHLHSTHHSDGILTENKANAAAFTKRIDSAVVYVNSSTRFSDGSQLGLGAEVAISTQRLHARGPMALRELTTYKWVVVGDYSVRE